MTDCLRHEGFHVRRDIVMQFMKELDAEGVEFRRRRRISRKIYMSSGPNHTWHVDGYDKLKPFGFCIHGCIDGFSRKILWLKVAATNNDPEVIASYFVKYVDSIAGCPRILQADPGTENFVIGVLQSVFRSNSTDAFSGERSFRVVRSVFNQRIEAWWRMLRRHKSQWFIDLFKDLEAFGAFHKDNADDLYCLRYSFMPILQQELDRAQDQWNNHRIAWNRKAGCPGGRPIVLYSTPESEGAEDCLVHVGSDDIQMAYNQCRDISRSGSLEFDMYAEQTLSLLNWNDAINVDDALKQYFHLKSVLMA